MIEVARSGFRHPAFRRHRKIDQGLHPCLQNEYHFDTTGKQRGPMTSLLPALRRAAPRLTRQLFQWPHHRPLPRVATRIDLFREASPKGIRAFKSSARRVSTAASSSLAPGAGSSPSVLSLSKSVGQHARKTRSSFFPNKSEKSVAYWLLGSAASVFGIVVFGGLTRLTESGYAALF